MANAFTPHRLGVNLFDSFRNEMESLIQKFDGEPTETPSGVAAWAPRVDVEETETDYRIHADLPGVDPKDVDIRLQNQSLTIRGTKAETKEGKSKNYHRIERFVGQFYRALTLPADISTEGLSAVGSNGTITITIPKKLDTPSKKIEVQQRS